MEVINICQLKSEVFDLKMPCRKKHHTHFSDIRLTVWFLVPPVTGGLDHYVRLWNPYVTAKATAVRCLSRYQVSLLRMACDNLNHLKGKREIHAYKNERRTIKKLRQVKGAKRWLWKEGRSRGTEDGQRLRCKKCCYAMTGQGGQLEMRGKSVDSIGTSRGKN